MMKNMSGNLIKKLHVLWQRPDWVKMYNSSFKLEPEWKKGRITSSSCTHLDVKLFWWCTETMYSFHIWNPGKSEDSTLYLSFRHPFPLLPFLSFPSCFLNLLSLPSFFPSAWQEQLRVHGEQGCSRRHLWKRALATDLSSSAIPGQGRLQGTLAVRKHTLDEGGRMRQEERERNKCNGRETGKQSLKRKKNVVLIIYLWFCQARKHENEIRMSEE